MSSSANLSADLIHCFENLSEEYRDLYGLDEVPIVNGIPTTLEFVRNWLAINKPVIFRNAISHWPAVKKWDPSYLKSMLGNEEITVAVTPNGYADAINNGLFVMPEERKMTIEKFLNILNSRDSVNGVFCIQKQNSNMIGEFRKLIYDVDSDIEWTTEALEKKPDAINFWMGDERAVTSMHRDHYENMYCVIRGQKEFILLPPTDIPWIPYDTYECAVYQEDKNGEFQIMKTGDEVPWISVDPLNPDYERYPLYKKAKPLHCTVIEGDILYLPSLWFHHVRQSHGCIAVNYWYDMDFDIKYCYHKFLEKVVPLFDKVD